MLKLCSDAVFYDNLTCTHACDGIQYSDFNYYDKDGFELTVAERRILMHNGADLRSCLNHWTWHRDWLSLNVNRSLGLHLDHCMLLHRPSFDAEALHYLQNYPHPCAVFMSKSKPKWGLDFALDHVEGQDAVEVLHVELDDYDLARISERKAALEEWLTQQDLLDLARKIRDNRSHWQHLTGYAQNDWKAQYLLGWDFAFYTEKSHTA